MNHGQQATEDSRHDDDAALTEFLASLMDYTPTIPDDLVEYYLARCEFQHRKAEQAFIIKVTRDKQPKDRRLILMMDNLSKVLHEYGVNVKHQEYFADSSSTGVDPASRAE